MATNRNRNHSNPPPRKKSKPAAKMNVDNRDSLSEFQSSIFDASDGHQLVDFIRKKKGLRAQPQKIFDDVPTNRQSLHIEIQRLDEHKNKTTQREETTPSQLVEDNENQPSNENNTHNRVSPRKMSVKSPIHPKSLFKRLSQSIGRRTLLKEFEKTLQESRFLPPTCSTPLTDDLTTTRTNTMKEKMESVNQGNLNIVCTPITISDEESPNPENRSKQTSEMAKDLEEQVDFVLETSPNGNLLIDEACEDSEEDAPSNHHSQTLTNRTSTPKKPNNRQTYTIERDNLSGNLILSPSKSVGGTSRHSILLRTPERSTTKKLIVTPKQKQLLFSKFGRSSQVMSSPPKAQSPPRSRIPKLVHGSTATAHAASEPDTYVESANLSQQHPETVKIIEQLQKKNTSNVPVIVIPVNQTFNQAPNPEPVTTATSIQSPRPLEPALVSSPAKPKTRQLPPESSSSSSKGSTPVKMNSLRLKDILTEDESSDYHPYFSRSRKAIRRKFKKSLDITHHRLSSRQSNRHANKLSLTAKPPLNTSKVREVIKPHQLSRMSEGEILDLRKRNSCGELRQSMRLTQRESSLLGKQMELELLRRDIQENYNDEVLQMEVLPPPPDEFCDMSLQRSKEITVHLNDDFVDEMSGDRVSLNRRERFSKSNVSQKPTRKKKKVSEQVERYLETSQKIQKSKFMNLSKRKLYSKGDSEECSSTDSQPLHKPTTPNQTTKRKSSQRKSNKVPSTPPPAQPTQSPPSPPPEQSTQSPPTQHTSMSSQQKQKISNESVNKTEQFLPQNNEVSEKPVKKTTRKYIKKPKKPLAPVDPDMGTSFVPVNDQENLCRRSKREKKLPMAYWSTQNKFCLLYDYKEVMDKRYAKFRKKAPTIEKDLVANTKEAKSNGVGESTRNKKQSDKQHKGEKKSKRTKPAKEPEDDASRDNEFTATELNTQQSNDDNKDRQQEKKSKKSKKSKEKNYENEFRTEQLMDDPCPDITSEANAPATLPESEATPYSKERLRTASNHSREPTVKLNQLSKSLLSASMQASSGYSSDVSSVQQIRLATIAEDSVPSVHPTNAHSTMASVNENRLSRELMPPPPSTEFIRSKKSSSKIKHSKKSAFRTEHDKSIADASSDHLNRLFDQLKNSSVCTSSDMAASVNQNNCSGQASAPSRTTEINSILEKKCKKFTVQLPRMKIKEKSTYKSEKVCDSGFSSEDMPSVPKQKGDVLFNWLKQMVVNSKSTSGADKGVARFLQADGVHTSSVEDLNFQEIDGVEYAFYNTNQPFSIGYIRFNPKTGKKKSTAKKFELNFVVLSGKLNITVNNTKFDCKNGDLITVFIGTSYVIQNISNDPALVMVIKK